MFNFNYSRQQLQVAKKKVEQELQGFKKDMEDLDLRMNKAGMLFYL